MNQNKTNNLSVYFPGSLYEKVFTIIILFLFLYIGEKIVLIYVK